MKKRQMYLRMITASLIRRRSRMLVALLSIAIGATVLSGLVTIYYDVPRQMGAQFRNYGANMIFTPSEEGFTLEDIQNAAAVIDSGDLVGIAPYRYENVRINAIPVVAGALVFADLVVRKVRVLQEQRERELAQIEQQRSQFITDIAHDLRTPLMAISGMSHAMADGLVRDEAQRDEYLQSICDKTDKMGELVNAVFDYTKLGSGSFELNREAVDLSQLLLREAAIAYTDAEDAGMQLTTCIPEERCPVFADQVQLSRVVANLIANGIRHNDRGCEVAVILVRQAGTVYVMVADTGIPIEGNAEDLFQPFAQGDAVRSMERGGSGLGLSICKKVADMHGFDLSIAQPYGRFTKAFVLKCPLME